jgi:phospholipid/cholesterol/gamma-HCH transport system ATP-binding protein
LKLAKNPRIQVRSLVVRYGDLTVLDSVGFDVFEGEILVIMGGSGCGKSTLMRHMIGLEQPDSGSVRVEGTDIATCSDGEFRGVLRKIGVLFQGSALFGSMTVAQNVAVPLAAYSGLARDAIAALVGIKLQIVGLEGYGNYLPSELSGGMKKRAGLARALAMNPRILFLDEPSAGLDPITSAEIDELILHINRTTGTTMVIVTHELASVFTLGGRIVMLDKRARGIIAEGDPRRLKETSRNAYVRQFFNRQAKPESLSEAL